MTDAPSADDFLSQVKNRKEELSRQLVVIGRNAKYWGDRHKTGLNLIGMLTFTATLIMAFNLAFKDNIRNVGGWMPFCFASAALTALATYFVAGQTSEEPGTNRVKCLQGMADVRAMFRELQSKKEWNQRKLQSFDRKLKAMESEYSAFLVDPPRFRTETAVWVLFVLVVLSYITYEFVFVTRGG